MNTVLISIERLEDTISYCLIDRRVSLGRRHDHDVRVQPIFSVRFGDVVNAYSRDRGHSVFDDVHDGHVVHLFATLGEWTWMNEPTFTVVFFRVFTREYGVIASGYPNQRVMVDDIRDHDEYFSRRRTDRIL